MVLVWTAMLLCAPGLWYEARPTFSEVEIALSRAFESLKSYKAVFRTWQDMPTPTGAAKQDIVTTVHWKRKGASIFCKKDGTGTSSGMFNGREIKANDHRVAIYEGQSKVSFSGDGSKTVFKDPIDSDELGDIHRAFELLKQGGELKLLDDRDVEKIPCFVIEQVPKKGAWEEIVKFENYYAKETGIEIKSVGLDKNGKTVWSKSLVELSVGPEIDDEIFRFKIPESANIVDRTKK